MLQAIEHIIESFRLMEMSGSKVGDFIIEVDYPTYENIRMTMPNIHYSRENRRGDPPDLIFAGRIRFRAIRNYTFTETRYI